MAKWTAPCYRNLVLTRALSITTMVVAALAVVLSAVKAESTISRRQIRIQHRQPLLFLPCLLRTRATAAAAALARRASTYLTIESQQQPPRQQRFQRKQQRERRIRWTINKRKKKISCQNKKTTSSSSNGNRRRLRVKVLLLVVNFHLHPRNSLRRRRKRRRLLAQVVAKMTTMKTQIWSLKLRIIPTRISLGEWADSDAYSATYLSFF